MKGFRFPTSARGQKYSSYLIALGLVGLACFGLSKSTPPYKNIESYPLSRRVALSNGAVVDSVNALESTVLDSENVIVSVHYTTTSNGAVYNKVIYDTGNGKPYHADFDTIEGKWVKCYLRPEQRRI